MKSVFHYPEVELWIACLKAHLSMACSKGKSWEIPKSGRWLLSEQPARIANSIDAVVSRLRCKRCGETRPKDLRIALNWVDRPSES